MAQALQSVESQLTSLHPSEMMVTGINLEHEAPVFQLFSVCVPFLSLVRSGTQERHLFLYRLIYCKNASPSPREADPLVIG